MRENSRNGRWKDNIKIDVKKQIVSEIGEIIYYYDHGYGQLGSLTI
jgi:hypothetical protein